MEGIASVRSECGFTLVELLVVMLILGLLSAIALPAFFNQQAKARDTDAKADVNHVVKLRSYSLATSNIRLETVRARRLPRVWADRGQMEHRVGPV